MIRFEHVRHRLNRLTDVLNHIGAYLYMPLLCQSLAGEPTYSRIVYSPPSPYDCFRYGLDNLSVDADVKIMDRFFRHRELPDSENFSKPGFQLKTA